MSLYCDAAFDKIAAEYDALWSETPIGKAQRSAVTNAYLTPLSFAPSQTIVFISSNVYEDR